MREWHIKYYLYNNSLCMLFSKLLANSFVHNNEVLSFNVYAEIDNLFVIVKKLATYFIH